MELYHCWYCICMWLNFRLAFNLRPITEWHDLQSVGLLRLDELQLKRIRVDSDKHIKVVCRQAPAHWLDKLSLFFGQHTSECELDIWSAITLPSISAKTMTQASRTCASRYVHHSCPRTATRSSWHYDLLQTCVCRMNRCRPVHCLHAAQVACGPNGGRVGCFFCGHLVAEYCPSLTIRQLSVGVITAELALLVRALGIIQNHLTFYWRNTYDDAGEKLTLLVVSGTCPSFHFALVSNELYCFIGVFPTVWSRGCFLRFDFKALGIAVVHLAHIKS